ncbi:MAG: hypothetical protein ACXWVJ_06465 [Caulobacteraceae bacterium]
MRPILSLVAAASLLAPGAMAQGVAPGQYAFHPVAEALYGVSIRPRGVTIVVASNGCTRKDDFRAEVRRGHGRPAILFRRMEPDNCRSFAAGDARFTYSWRELGVRPNPRIGVLNEITRDPAPSPLSPAG